MHMCTHTDTHTKLRSNIIYETQCNILPSVDHLHTLTGKDQERMVVNFKTKWIIWIRRSFINYLAIWRTAI